MTTLRSSYKLKRFVSSRDPDFAAALLLYLRNTPANIRTDSNEITYWIDEFSAKFGDPFYVFGFYRDRHLVGYAEAAYFRTARLFVLDYVVIDESSRRNNVFYEFVDQLKRYLEVAHPEYRYGAVEVGYGPQQRHPSQPSALLIRLLKLQGFRVVRALYYTPRLTLDDAESGMQADLLLFAAGDVESIHAETYLSIVRTIYFDYYLRWKSIIPDPGNAYKKHLDDLFSKVQSSLGRRKTIVVNGHKALLSAPIKKPLLTVHRIVVFSFQALLVIVLVTTAMLGLKTIFRLSNSSFAYIYLLAVVSFVTVAGIVSKDARTVFAEIVSLIKYLSHRKANGLTTIESADKRSLPPDPDER